LFGRKKAMKLNSLVKVPDRNIEQGRVVQEINYLNGSTHFAVGSMRDKEYMHDFVHLSDIELISEDGAVDTPKASKRLPLGAEVRVLPSRELRGIITAHARSSSGCVEYEVTAYVPGVGSQRKLYEEQLLEVVSDADKIQSGAEGGSVTRTLGQR
jgi:hypothetical protein